MFRLVLLLTVVSMGWTTHPPYCSYEDVIGTWSISETARVGDARIDCSTLGEVMYQKTFIFTYPDLVTDEFGFTGKWTVIGAMGVEFNIQERSYYSEFDYGHLCTHMMVGTARDDTVRHFSCFISEREPRQAPGAIDEDITVSKESMSPFTNMDSAFLDKYYVNDHDFIRRLNEAQNSWTAKAYPEHEKYTNREMIQRFGGIRRPLPSPAPATEEEIARAALLPENFDWRDVGGVNYVSPVRDQLQCGSCYSFASMGLVEARVRIETGNERQDIFSPQEIVNCNKYSAGCGGGYSFLSAGRHGIEHGLVNEDCVPYLGQEQTCTTDTSCPRTYASEYQYVGGYYGGCNDQNMMESLVTRGPFTVDYEIMDDFGSYTGGIYHHVASVKPSFDPYEAVNHEVLMVGYGVEPTTGEKFWIVKNSWGATWGEEGYFRIRRGTNEVSIESAAVDVTVIS